MKKINHQHGTRHSTLSFLLSLTPLVTPHTSLGAYQSAHVQARTSAAAAARLHVSLGAAMLEMQAGGAEGQCGSVKQGGQGWG